MILDAVASAHAGLELAALLATTAFAWRLGGRAERLGALLLVAGWLIATSTGLILGAASSAAALLNETLGAGGLLLVAVRYSSLWLGPALLSYSGGFALHAVRLGAVDPPAWPGLSEPMMHETIGYLVLLAVAGGTLAAMIERHRAAKLRAAPPPPAGSVAAI
jgi:hypothetical protein